MAASPRLYLQKAEAAGEVAAFSLTNLAYVARENGTLMTWIQ